MDKAIVCTSMIELDPVSLGPHDAHGQESFTNVRDLARQNLSGETVRNFLYGSQRLIIIYIDKQTTRTAFTLSRCAKLDK